METSLIDRRLEDLEAAVLLLVESAQETVESVDTSFTDPDAIASLILLRESLSRRQKEISDAIETSILDWFVANEDDHPMIEIGEKIYKPTVKKKVRCPDHVAAALAILGKSNEGARIASTLQKVYGAQIDLSAAIEEIGGAFADYFRGFVSTAGLRVSPARNTLKEDFREFFAEEWPERLDNGRTPKQLVAASARFFKRRRGEDG